MVSICGAHDTPRAGCVLCNTEPRRKLVPDHEPDGEGRCRRDHMVWPCQFAIINGFQEEHAACRRAIAEIKRVEEQKTEDLRKIHERSIERLEEINEQLRLDVELHVDEKSRLLERLAQSENERLSAWALRAYMFIQTLPCRCGAADECTAHSLIFEYQQALG